MKQQYSSSSGLEVVSWCHANSRAVVFYTLHRGQGDTRLFPIISYRSLRCTLTFVLTWESSVTFLGHSSPWSPSAVAAAASRTPAISIPTCSRQRIPTCSPGSLYNPSHRSKSDHVTIHYATVFCRCLIYSYIVKNTASSLATADKVYQATIWTC